MRETWYVLESGLVADPAEVAPDQNGVLRHSSGIAVAMRGQVPMSRGVDPDEERGKTVSAGLSAEPLKRGYKTREARSGK